MSTARGGVADTSGSGSSAAAGSLKQGLADEPPLGSANSLTVTAELEPIPRSAEEAAGSSTGGDRKPARDTNVTVAE